MSDTVYQEEPRRGISMFGRKIKVKMEDEEVPKKKIKAKQRRDEDEEEYMEEEDDDDDDEDVLEEVDRKIKRSKVPPPPPPPPAYDDEEQEGESYKDAIKSWVRQNHQRIIQMQQEEIELIALNKELMRMIR